MLIQWSTRVLLYVGMIARHATARGVDDSAQQVAPGLSQCCGAHPTTSQDDHQIQNHDGDKGENGDFGDGHGRLLMVVRYGRGARVIDRRAGQCEVGHTSLRFFTAAKRHLRAFWERLVADEVCGRSIGYWLR
jgi:hypothetical protein